jgi:hypothetical protein
MEPSLRSSAPKASSCRLKKTDPSLHETMKRFVESHLHDTRISQYADARYAADKFKSGKWFWLSPFQGQVGYLVISPKNPIIWINEKLSYSFKIPMRVSTAMTEGGSIFIASLNTNEGMLRVEDLRVLSGNSLVSQPFSKRWATLLESMYKLYRVDTLLQQGLTISTAEYGPLDSYTSWEPDTTMMIAQGDTYNRRLRVQLLEDQQPQHRQTPQHKQTPQDRQPLPNLQVQAPRLENRPSIQEQRHRLPVKNKHTIFAIPNKIFPDTYTIEIDGVSKGYAAIQELSISRLIKQAAETQDRIPVNVEWRDDFSSYEILSIA